MTSVVDAGSEDFPRAEGLDDPIEVDRVRGLCKFVCALETPFAVKNQRERVRVAAVEDVIADLNTTSGLAAVDRGQMLAGKTLGLRSDQIFRLITLPQMIRVIIPPTGNEFITLLKLTSLASVISLREILTVTSQTIAVNFRFAELYAAATVWYLVIVSIFMVLQAQLEKRYQWTSREQDAGARPLLARAVGVGNR